MAVTAAQDSAPETVLRLAVLLQAGLAPAQAWTHLAEAGDAQAGKVVAGMLAGASLLDAIATAGASAAGVRRTRRPAEAEVWPQVAAAWRVASAVGAPLAESLRGLAAALREAQESADDVRVALAEPAGTARLMAWLPLVALALGASLGFDTLTVLVGSPLGLACLATGGALIVVAHRWNAALLRRAASDGRIPGLRAELLAIAMSGGVSLDRAAAIVDDATGGAVDESAESVLSLSRIAGVPAVELLRAAAALARHRARVGARLRAARLSSQLLLPLGVCILPAFLLLGVAPMLLSVVATMHLSL